MSTESGQPQSVEQVVTTPTDGANAQQVEQTAEAAEAVKTDTPEVKAPDPVSWEALKLPDTLSANEETQKAFVELMNKDMSPVERSQALVDIAGKMAQNFQESAVAEWEKVKNEWHDAARADPEIGGDKLDPTLGRISKLIDQFGGDEIRKVMDLTGAGDNPQMIKFLNKIALQLTEGGPTNGGVGAKEMDLARLMYPTMK